MLKLKVIFSYVETFLTVKTCKKVLAKIWLYNNLS